MAEPRVLTTIEQGIATVTLNRGDKHNGLDRAMMDGLITTAARLGKDRTVRAVILHGDGPSFCSGLDFGSVKKDKTFLAWVFMKSPFSRMNRAQRVSVAWRDLPVPVIAAIHGNCFGGGLQLAMGADFRLAHPDARFSVMEIRYGLVPDMGGTLAFREHVRLDALKELAMTGERVEAGRAAELGLVTRVVDDPLADARALAQTLAAQSPDAITATKRLFNEISDGSPDRLLWRERWAQMRVLGRTNQRKATGRRGDAPVEFEPRSWW